MPSLHPRCVQHGLVVAPDGLCVLCRRQPASAETSTSQDAQYTAPLSAAQSETSTGLKLLAPLAALLLTAAGVAFSLNGFGGAKPEPPSQALSAERPKPAQAAESELSELEKAKAADLTASLKFLERAEAERQSKQQLAAAQVEEQRKLTHAMRDQEEKERDQARHESVARDLEDQSLVQGRRRVQITLYGTDWCGVCKRARTYMRDKNIPFTEFDIDNDDAARTRAQALNPRLSVPTIAIDKELLIGFSPESLEDRIVRAARVRKL